MEDTPKLPKTLAEKSKGRRVIVVLEGANLETVKNKTEFQLLNCDDHQHILKKAHKDPSEYRPDICHQALLALLDSPLNKAGLMQVYIHTQSNVLIEINPQIRIPRTFKRFCGLMVQLLHKMKIRAASSSETLMKVVKNPVTNYFPVGCRKIGTSVQGKLVHMLDYVKTLPQDEPIVLAIGAVAHGSPASEVDYTDEVISVSNYPLSAAYAIGRITNAFESNWGIL
eukprot:GILK01003307.1.p1 GENE.GILK01003307.1~~GILK01003307.1.p1  ORF type:complete len:239 (-),score=24.55 GILK01003307.1:169-846(-)